jgi:hypothetical protein
MIVIPPNLAGQDLAGNGFAAMPPLQICSQQPSRQFYETR